MARLLPVAHGPSRKSTSDPQDPGTKAPVEPDTDFSIFQYPSCCCHPIDDPTSERNRRGVDEVVVMERGVVFST